MSAAITATTYRYERFRAVSTGILETAASTFLLLIAVRWFHAGANAKAVIAGGGSLGLLLSPIVVSRVESLGLPVTKAASRIAALGSASLVLMALLPFLPVFVVGSLVATACASSVIPLMTQVYQENYPELERGRMFSRTLMIRIGVAALFSELAGRLLSERIENYVWLLLIFAAAFAFASFCLARCPSRPLTAGGGSHPFRALRFAQSDRLFRWTLICWMFMGFASLMMFPMRVEYLSNPRYHLNLEVTTIALLVGVVPNLARLIMSPIWGWLFDHMNFFALRVTLNFGFLFGILSFFTSDSLNGLLLGAVIFGISNAGGDVAWGLWVTKFAPPDRVADYMSVHTCFTGIRGVIAPLAAFNLVAHFSMAALGWFSAGLILIATIMLIPEVKFGKTARPATPLAEDVSE